MIITIRGYEIHVNARTNAQRKEYERRYARYSDAELYTLQRESQRHQDAQPGGPREKA